MSDEFEDGKKKFLEAVKAIDAAVEIVIPVTPSRGNFLIALSKGKARKFMSVAEDDILVPPRFSREIAARVPGAELRVVAAAGHGYFLERPDVFNELSLDFLARHSARKA